MTNEFEYHLPEHYIAKFPLSKRDESKLLVNQNNEIIHSRFYNLPDFLPEKSLLVFNNTKVIHARFLFKKQSGAVIEVFCLEPLDNIETQLSAIHHSEWICLVGNLKKWKNDEILSIKLNSDNQDLELRVQLIDREFNQNKVQFSWDSHHTFAEIMSVFGQVPLPPYLKREVTTQDNDSYQTIYAKHEGAIAAPTAGLHFTPEVFQKLTKKGIHAEYITLHVGAGTFQPLKSKNFTDHPMHNEKIVFSKSFIQHLYRHNGTVISVGTTSLRALESLYWYGVKLAQRTESEFFIEKLFPYDKNLPALSKKQSLENVLKYLERTNSDYLYGSTEIMIMPGYRFCFDDALVTNFHQPKSTLILLVAAFAGNNWYKIYQSALENNYRFLSYGDSSLIFKL